MMICPPDHAHGETLTCYGGHGCRCDDCRLANTEYHFWRRHQRMSGRDLPFELIDSTGTIRRLQALACLGWSFTEVARRAGVAKGSELAARPQVKRGNAERIAVVYDELWDQLPPSGSRYERMVLGKTKTRAAQQGWAPPLAWDDESIDDPGASPAEWREAA